MVTPRRPRPPAPLVQPPEVLLPLPPPWMNDALCREYPLVNFFPGQGETADEALQVCGRCLVRAECLDYALTEGIRHGIWGGMNAAARRAHARLARLRAQAADGRESRPCVTDRRTDAD